MSRLASLLALFLFCVVSAAEFERDENPYAPPLSAGRANQAQQDWLVALETLSRNSENLESWELANQAQGILKLVPSIDAELAAADANRLRQLHPAVGLPTLAYADRATLQRWRMAVPEGEERSLWSQMVTVAEIYRCSRNQNLPLPRSYSGWVTLGNLALAGGAATLLQGYPEALAKLNPAALASGALGLLFTMVSAQYASYFRDNHRLREHALEREGSRKQLEAAQAYADKHSLPMRNELRSLAMEWNHLLFCAVYLAKIHRPKSSP